MTTLVNVGTNVVNIIPLTFDNSALQSLNNDSALNESGSAGVTEEDDNANAAPDIIATGNELRTNVVMEVCKICFNAS